MFHSFSSINSFAPKEVPLKQENSGSADGDTQHEATKRLHHQINSLQEKLFQKEQLIDSLERTVNELILTINQVVERHRQHNIHMSNDNEELMRSYKGLFDRIKRLEQREKDLIEELHEMQASLSQSILRENDLADKLQAMKDLVAQQETVPVTIHVKKHDIKSLQDLMGFLS